MPLVIDLMPASKASTPSPSRTRYTFIVFSGKPPRISQTPSATVSRSPVMRELRRVLALNALAMRSSALDPAPGSIPSWRAKPMLSMKASLLTILPSRTVRTSVPSRTIRAPFGSMPFNGAPANVPVARHCTAVWSPSLICTTISICASGSAASIPPRNSRTPSGAVVSTWPRTFSRPPGCQSATAPSRSRLPIASKYARPTPAAVPVSSVVAILGPSLVSPVWHPNGRMTTARRRRELGRGERVLPGVWRLRLPLPWPGVPHGNAWALAAGDGIVLVDTGVHAPGSMAHLDRAMDMVGLRVEHVRLLVCTHAHSDHYGQAGPIIDRAGCELWMHPDYGHMTRAAEDPAAYFEQRLEVALAS